MKLKIDNETLVEEFFECVWDTRHRCTFERLPVYLADKPGAWRFLQDQQQPWDPVKEKDTNYFFLFMIMKFGNLHGALPVQQPATTENFCCPNSKHLDFLWLVKGEEIDDADLSTLIQSLRSLPGVQLVNEMTHEKIRNKQHLIFVIWNVRIGRIEMWIMRLCGFA